MAGFDNFDNNKDQEDIFNPVAPVTQPVVSTPQPQPVVDIPQAPVQPAVIDPFATEEFEAPAAPAPIIPTAEVTTTRQPETPALTAIANKKAELAERAKSSLTQLQDVSAEGQAKKAQLMEGFRQEQEALDQEEQQLKSQFTQEYQTELSAIDAERQKLESMTPQTFWNKADTGDKLLMGLAILVGGIGQAMSGSKDNAAVSAMERAITQDLAIQESAFKRQVAALDRKKLSLKDKQQLESKMLGNLHARKQAGLNKFKSLIDQVSSQTKNEQARLKLDQLKQGVDQDLLEENQKFHEQLAGKIVTKSVQPVAKADPLAASETPAQSKQAALDAVFASAPIGSNKAKPMKLNEAQAKAASFVRLNEGTVKELEEIEKSLTPEEYDKLISNMRELQVRSSAADIPGIGPVVGGALAAFGFTMKEEFEDAIPGKGGRYYQALKTLANDQARFVSGATIKESEELDEIAKLGPQPGTKLQDIGTMVKRRRNLLKNYRMVSGQQGKKLFFEHSPKGKKK